MQFSLASAALITRIVSRAGRGPWSQTGDKHGAAHVHVGCTVGICGRTQRLQAWARVQLRRDWLRMGPRSYRHRQRCHHRRAPRQDGHHHRRRRRPAWRQALVSWQVGRPVAWPIAADTTSAPHSRHRSLLMVLLWCAAAKWRCGRVRLPNGRECVHRGPRPVVADTSTLDEGWLDVSTIDAVTVSRGSA